MNWTTIEGKWNEVSGTLRSKWGKLTDDDWQQIKGKRDVLVGKIQQRYGVQRDKAEAEIDDYVNTL